MIDAQKAGQIAAIAASGIRREFPHKPGGVLASAGDLGAPRELTPVFYGCFDWHSAVHGHFTLVRLLSLFPDAPWAGNVRALLCESFVSERVRGEIAYLERDENRGFELPYGIAWLLALCAEVGAQRAAAPETAAWVHALAPLEAVAATRFATWLDRLPCPIRSGQHVQSAFAMALARDWAEYADDADMIDLVDRRAAAFYGADRDGPITYEPSAYDFLSPCLGEADLMRRCLPATAFATWLDGFLPGFTSLPLRPVQSADPSDGKLAHFDGLNASRAWMLEGIARALPTTDPRRAAALQLADAHGRAAMEALTRNHYAVTHWVGTFLVYYLTAQHTAVT